MSVVSVSMSAPITTITLTNPQQRNPLSLSGLTLISKHLAAVAKNRKIKVVIIRSEGPVFSAGHDLKELSQCNRAKAKQLFSLCSKVMKQLRTLPQPVIAQVQGLATAAGCQLVAGCDLAVAAESAKFATPGVRIGLFCSSPAVPICRAIPTKKALEMLFTGEAISAREAQHLGLINQVVADAELSIATLKLAKTIISFSASTLADGKRAFYQQLALSENAAYAFVEKKMVEHLSTKDAKEGISAFLEKRSPNWT